MMRLLYGLVAVVFLANSLPAQEYSTEVIARELDHPTGITVDLDGNLYFTEVPTPGVPGSQGGSNRVRVLLPDGTIETISEGEPEPLNLTASIRGDVYWTCRTAGVIRKLDARSGIDQTVLMDLDTPVGISVNLLSRRLYWTEVPTPGMNGDNGGNNAVVVRRQRSIRVVDFGDPEPNDVVVTVRGDVYWTCTSAGVIVERKRNGQTSVILRELNQPTGITADWLGNLYFTELPTPGVSGSDGGQNKVWRYDLRRKQLLLVDDGDPEPRDITASPLGDLYWTCTTAGVIVEAKLQRFRRR